MLKVAVFTEGQAEQLFICEAIRQLSGNTRYFVRSFRKNGSGDRLIKIDIGIQGQENDHDIYFQVLNCGSDAQVLSTIREEHDSLVVAGFTHIFGLRDLFPIARDKLDKLKDSIERLKPTSNASVDILVAIMEIEAWFIAEYDHFSGINQILTPDFIRISGGIDVTRSSEDVNHPFEALHAIYSLAGDRYEKSRSYVERTVSLIHMPNYLTDAGIRAPTARIAIDWIQNILSSSAPA